MRSPILHVLPGVLRGPEAGLAAAAFKSKMKVIGGSLARGLVCCIVLLAATSDWVIGTPSALQQRVGSNQQAAVQSDFLRRHCISCHNDRLKTGGLSLETVDPTNVSGNAALWEKVVRKLRAGMMPPLGRPRPDPSSYNAFLSGLEFALDQAARDRPNPGRIE